MSVMEEEYRRNWRAIYAHSVRESKTWTQEMLAADYVRELSRDIWQCQGDWYLGVGYSSELLRSAGQALIDLAEARVIAKAEKE